MNDDKWQRTVAKRRRQRRIQNLFACFVVLLVLLILSIIGGITITSALILLNML